MAVLFKERKPGPGSYNVDIRPINPSPPAYTMGGKWKDSSTSNWKPGPGFYTPEMPKRGPVHSNYGKHLDQVWVPDMIHKNQVFSESDPDRPGRGINTRIPLRELSPGPGSYNLPQLSTGPVYSVRAKSVLKNASDAPGPGWYSPRTRVHSPSYRISDRPIRRENSDPTPGPGQYYPELKSVHWLKKEPAYTIGNKLQLDQHNAIPGPGWYSPRDSFTLRPQSTPLLPKRRTEIEDSTESLDMDDGGNKKTHSESRRRITRSVHVNLQTPGPGWYSPYDHFGGPAYTIGIKYSVPEKDYIPGPGSYQQ